MARFWGLVLESGRRYMQKVESGFCISMAVLDSDTTGTKESQGPSEKTVKMYVERDKAQYLLCTLSPKVAQLPLRIKFGKGETVAFYFVGGSASTKIHCTGYSFTGDKNAVGAVPFRGQNQSILVSEPKSADKKNKDKRVSIKDSPEASREASSSDDDEDDDDLLALANGLDDSDSDEDEDEVQVLRDSTKNSVTSTTKAADDSDDDDDDEEEDDDEDDDDDDSDDVMESEDQPKPQLSSPKKSENRKSEPPPVMKTPENQNLKLKQPSSAGHTPMKNFSKGGVLCQEIKVGAGQLAKQGRMVTVYYVGKLKSNNKKFDASENGPGFKFKLGKGEVIKGWDLGVEGMKVGGKRRLTIPANLAYGKKGAPPDIPPNSTLVFDVELRNVS